MKPLRKLDKVKSLMKGYYSIESQLKRLEVIRSRKLIHDLGEWYASVIFGLELATNQSQKGYDGTQKVTGKKFQVKTHRKTMGNPNATWIDLSILKESIRPFDYLVLLHLNDEFKLNSLYIIPFAEFRKNNFPINRKRTQFKV